jgi:hypothetical protein
LLLQNFSFATASTEKMGRGIFRKIVAEIGKVGKETLDTPNFSQALDLRTGKEIFFKEALIVCSGYIPRPLGRNKGYVP